MAETNGVAASSFRFLERGWADYERVTGPALADPSAAAAAKNWTLVRKRGGSSTVELGHSVVLQVEPGVSIEALIAQQPLVIRKRVGPNLVILEAADSAAAIDAAQALAPKEGVITCHPVMRRPFQHQGVYHTVPNDPYFSEAWQLDNRGSSGNRTGPDLNVRAAWPETTGAGVVVAVADTGVELDHPDLKRAAASGPHYNFFEEIADGAPFDSKADHGTAVAGLIAAESGNKTGISGVAPDAGLASWVVFGISPLTGQEDFATDEQLMNLFQNALDSVAVQNHSWGSASAQQSGIDALSDSAIQKAVTQGRGGKGVVMVRAGGNERLDLSNVNDDEFASDPRVIAVGAVRKDGRVCAFSSPGASLLVSAPSGDLVDVDGDGQLDSEDPLSPGVKTTDRVGDLGFTAGTNDAANYGNFDGTSASSPEIAGVVALLLSANPELTYRDVQQILVLSSRHYDLADPDRKPNGAGLYFSHNLGFGVPDAGVAVGLAKQWIKRPPAIRVTRSSTVSVPIPDDSLRVVASSVGISTALPSIHSLPSRGLHPDAGTAALPLVSVGLANGPLTVNLQGKAALIQRGVNFFSNKIDRVMQAGASFAIIYNNTGTTAIQAMGATDFAPIPAVSISKSDGDALVAWLASHPTTTVKLELKPAVTTFNVTNTLSCEHVGVRLKTTHSRRADVRVTLVSPVGTRSILQVINSDTQPGPTDWTYWSTKHFYESSAGTWRVEVSDERGVDQNNTAVSTGTVTAVDLILEGVPILDTDHDGLADDWEIKTFGTLTHTASEDADQDGLSNLQEQIVGTDPTVPNSAFQAELANYDATHWRLTWPGRNGVVYSVKEGTDLGIPFSALQTVSGVAPVTEVIVPKKPAPQFFYLEHNP